MPFKGFVTFLKRIVALFLFLFNPRKQAIEYNLEMLGITKHKGRIAFQTYYNLFNAYLMLLVYTFFKKRPRFLIHNEEFIREGKIFVSIHYGPWDIGLRLVHEKYPFVSVVGKKDFLNFLREKQGIKLIYSTDGFARIVEVAKKERVALMLDRTFYEKGVFIPVGRSYLKISRAAIMLARRTRQDMFFIRAEGGENKVELFITKIPYGSYEKMLTEVGEIIREMLLSKPEWWLNFFATWRS